MRMPNRHSEKGIALVLSILALLLLSAIAVGMMYTSSTEASVNSNFKSEETEYFAARAGVEEVRDRMLPYNPNTINDYLVNNLGVDTCQNAAKCVLPTAMPVTGFATAPVLYILQSGITMADVTGFAANSKCPPSASTTSCLVDDEFCHDFPSFGSMTAVGNNVRCTDLPSGSTWYSTPATPTAPSSYVTAAPYSMDWKWVRVTLKGNASSNPYCVDGNCANTTLQVCWDGSTERVAPTGTAVSTVNNSPCGTLNPFSNPVYLVTALAVSSSGTRRLVQQEIAQTPNTQPAGLFATSGGCAALKMSGGATTHSFSSGTEVGGPTNPPSNVLNSGGDVGANGNIDVSGNNTQVNGTTLTNMVTTNIGSCSNGNITAASGNGTYGTTTPPVQNIPTYPAAYAPSIPSVPNPMPPTGNVNENNQTMLPGAYGDVQITGGTTTLPGGTATSPAVYTFNSLSVSGGGQLAVNGPVIINIAYQGNGNAITLGSADAFANNTYVASNLVFNYCCSGSVSISGGSAAYAVFNAPSANISFSGGSNFYGQAIGATIDDTGSSTNFYWDKSANISPVTSPYYEISLRELSY
jgi:hypothetical protein